MNMKMVFFGLQRIMKEEKRIRKVLSTFSDFLFFGEDINGNLKIYKFNIIKLKNNDFILYSY